jgi:hypothetical protein
MGTREIIPEVTTEAADRIGITQATIIPIETGATEMMKEKSQEVETAQWTDTPEETVIKTTVEEVEIVAIVKAPWTVESAETLEITHLNQKILTITCMITLIGSAPQACVSIIKTANAR